MSLLSDDEQPMSDQNSLLGARRPSSAPAPRKTIKFRKSNLLESIPDSNLTNKLLFRNLIVFRGAGE